MIKGYSNKEPSIAVHNVFSTAIPNAFGITFLHRLLKNKEYMITIENFRYLIDMSCAGDSWRACGNVYDHPDRKNGEFIFISTPKSFDENSRVITTFSGKQYKINSFAECDSEKWVNEIKKQIAKRIV